MERHRYTAEQVEFLRREFPGRSYAEMTERFNARFGTTLTLGQINGAVKNRKLTNGRDTRLKSGNVPFNKGVKGFNATTPNSGRFLKGHLPRKHRPVGSERINTDGYAEVKTADPRTWRMKHVLIWEAVHGPVPKGHAVAFGDGDKRNLSLDNLVLVSRRQLAVMNKKGLFGGSAELTMAGRTIADIYMKINERKPRSRKEGQTK